MKRTDKQEMRKDEKFVIRALKGIGYSLLGEVLCIFLVMSMNAIIVVMDVFILKILLALCTLTVTLGLYFNWAVNAAKLDKDMVKFHGKEYDRLMPLKMAVAGPIFGYLWYIALVLSVCGVIPDIFNFYLLGNIYIAPFVASFTDGRTLEYLTLPGFAGITGLVVLQPATIAVTYIVTYHNVDVKKLVFYKK